MSAADPKFPSRKLAIVTCMDCRIDPLEAYGVDLGEAHVIRNAGAVVTADVRRSLALSQRALETEEVWVIAHTKCGVLGLDDEAFLDQVEDDCGTRPDWEPGGFPTLEEGVRRGIASIEHDPALREGPVRGFVLDLDSGELEECGQTS